MSKKKKVEAPKKKIETSPDWRIWNMSSARRGLPIGQNRHVFIEPRGWYDVPLKEREEIERLFKTETYQRLLDGGFLVLSAGKPVDEDVKKQETPEPPEELSGEVKAGSFTETFVAEPPEVTGSVTVSDVE